MEEKTKKQIAKEKAEQKAIEKENKILSIALPVVGIICLIFSVLGLILTLKDNQIGITVTYGVFIGLGLLANIYGVILLIRLKKPDFLKKKKVEEVEDEVLAD